MGSFKVRQWWKANVTICEKWLRWVARKKGWNLENRKWTMIAINNKKDNSNCVAYQFNRWEKKSEDGREINRAKTFLLHWNDNKSIDCVKSGWKAAWKVYKVITPMTKAKWTTLQKKFNTKQFPRPLSSRTDTTTESIILVRRSGKSFSPTSHRRLASCWNLMGHVRWLQLPQPFINQLSAPIINHYM